MRELDIERSIIEGNLTRATISSQVAGSPRGALSPTASRSRRRNSELQTSSTYVSGLILTSNPERLAGGAS